MAEAVKVAFEGAEYTLDVPADSTVVRGPVQREFFTEVDRVSAIQEAIGVEVTGVWDEATNEQFAMWLRVQQATHMGIEESDGWWGPKSEAALAGQIDPDALKALTELRESGRLKKLTYRTDVHNATWEQVESDVEERAAAPDATDAERTLASTMKGEEIVEEPVAAEPIVTEPPIEANAIAPSLILAGAAGATLLAKRYFDGWKLRADNANDIASDTPRRFTIDDMDIDVPKAASDIDVRPTGAPLDRPVIDADRVMTDFYARPYISDTTPRLAAFDGSAAIDLRVASADVVPTTGYARLLANDPDFAAAIKEVESRLLPDLNRSFDAAANNNNIVDPVEARVDAEARAAVEGVPNEYTRLRADIAADISTSALDAEISNLSLELAQARPVVVAAPVTPGADARIAPVAEDVAPVITLEQRAAIAASNPTSALDNQINELSLAAFEARPTVSAPDISARVATDNPVDLEDVVAADLAKAEALNNAADADLNKPVVTSPLAAELDAARQAILMDDLNGSIMPPNQMEIDLAAASVERFNAALAAGSVDPADLAYRAVADAIDPEVRAQMDDVRLSAAMSSDLTGDSLVDPILAQRADAVAAMPERVTTPDVVAKTPDANPASAIDPELRTAILMNDLNGPIMVPDALEVQITDAMIDRANAAIAAGNLDPADLAYRAVADAIDPEVRAQMDEIRISAASSDLSPDPLLDPILTQRAADVAAMPARVVTPDVDIVKPVVDPEIVAYEAVQAALNPDAPTSPEVVDTLATESVRTAIDPDLAPEIETAERVAPLTADPIDPVAEYERISADAISTLDAEVARLDAELVDPSPVSPDAEYERISANALAALDAEVANLDADRAVMGGLDIERSFAAVDASVDPNLQQALLSSSFLTATTAPAVETEEVRLNLSDAPDTYRAANVGDLAALPSANELPNIHMGNLTGMRKLGSSFVGTADVMMAGMAGGMILSVTDLATAGRFSEEMIPIWGSKFAFEDGRTAEGFMRLTEDIGGVLGTGALASGGAVLAGPVGGFGGAAGGMILTVEISNGIRGLARSMGIDVDEGMNSQQLTSFIGSLASVYPQLYASVQDLDAAERISLSSSSVDIALRHSKYTMEGLSSEDAYARVGEDLANEDAALGTEQKTLLEGIVGLESLTDGRPIEEALADPEAFSEIYRYYKSMATANPDDPQMALAAENLGKYNELALQRVNLDYGQLMVDRMGIAPELAELEMQGPRDEMIYHRYSDIVAQYDDMSPEQQEEYAWVNEAAQRYERRLELTDGFTDARDEIAINSRHLAHIADDIGHADAGLEAVSSQSIAAEQDALIAQMGEEFGITAEELRADPNLVQGLFQRYNDSQGPLGFFSDLTNGGTFKMSEEQAGILTQFTGLESARQHQAMLESSPIQSSEHVEIQLEIFRRLPLTETEDMSYPMRMLIQAKNGLMDAEGNFAGFSEDDAQDLSDYWIRKASYGDTVNYMESNWAQNYGVVERQPEVFESLLKELDIEFEKPEGAMRTVDYTYKLPESAPAPAL